MKDVISVLFIALVMSAGQVKAAEPVKQMVTGLTVFDSDTTFRYMFLYSEGKKTLETKYYSQGNNWVGLSQTEWYYESNQCKTQTERRWKNNQWADTYEIGYDYVNGSVDTETHSAVDNKIRRPLKKIVYRYKRAELSSRSEYACNSDVWTQTLQTDYGYSGVGKIDSIQISVFQGGNVINQYLFKNAYNADGTLSLQLQQEKAFSDSKWNNVKQIKMFYLKNSNLVSSQRIKKWRPEFLVWENDQRIDYEYNSNNQLIFETCQYWKTMFWENVLRYVYLYDTNGALLKKTVCKPLYHQWRELISINYSDFTGNKANHVDSKYEFWGGNAGELVTSYIPFDFNDEIIIQKGKSLQAVYNDTLSSKPEVADFRTVPVYPNPSDGIFYVNTQEYKIQSWIITDLAGRTLKNRLQTMNSGVVDITDLPKGIYILKLTTSTGIYTQKLFKN